MSDVHLNSPPDRAVKRRRSKGPKASLFDIQALPENYAMRCDGDCMEPLYPDGCTLGFDRVAPCRVGDQVVIWFRPETVKRGAPSAIVKQLIMKIPDDLTLPHVLQEDENLSPIIAVRSLNPIRTYYIDCRDVVAVHRCVGEVVRGDRGQAMIKKSSIAEARGKGVS